MSEFFQVRQAEKVVAHTKLTPDDVEEMFDPVPKDEKGAIVTDFKQILNLLFDEASLPRESLRQIELEKTERDKELIDVAIDAVKRFAKEYGREEFVDLPLEHIRLLKDGGVNVATKGRFNTGSHATVLGEVLIDRRSDLETVITLFHELWHTLATYHAIQLTKAGKIAEQRNGLTVRSGDGKHLWFDRLEEALTGLINSPVGEEVLVSDHDFQKEIAQLKSSKSLDTTRREEVSDFLKQVFHPLYLRNRNQFKTEDELLKKFFQAEVTGKIFPIAQLIEKTFGKGAFRRLARW